MYKSKLTLFLKSYDVSSCDQEYIYYINYIFLNNNNKNPIFQVTPEEKTTCPT